MLKNRNSNLKDRLIEMIYECETQLDRAINKEKLEEKRNSEEAKTAKRVSKVVNHLKLFKAVE
jgi:hypothetical protein